MERYFIINPAAGRGKSKSIAPEGETTFFTTAPGDARRFTEERLAASTDRIHFVVFGGDGALNEVVNGIMHSGAADRAVFSMVPCGTGNDFVRSFSLRNNEYEVDVIRYNDSYAVNLINIGFDCQVVARVEQIKRLPIVPGSLAYILGVMNVLCKKMGQSLSLELTEESGRVVHVDSQLLLCVIANASYYGGGFNAAPTADPSDGLLDILLVDKVTRRKFISLVGDYKQGRHIDPQTRSVIPRFSSIMKYSRCKSLKINTPVKLCADGEISEQESVDISLIPRALKFISL